MGQGLFPKERSPFGNFTVGPIKCQSTLFGELGNLEKEKTSCLFFPVGQLRQEPSADKWSYESACNFCILAKLIMTCQGIFGEFIFETTL